jgi:hypothetical protein
MPICLPLDSYRRCEEDRLETPKGKAESQDDLSYSRLTRKEESEKVAMRLCQPTPRRDPERTRDYKLGGNQRSKLCEIDTPYALFRVLLLIAYHLATHEHCGGRGV